MGSSSLTEMFSKKDAPQHEANPQENQNEEVRSKQSCLATLLKSHPGTDAPQKCYVDPQNILLQENNCRGLLLYVKRVLKAESSYLAI